MQAVYRPEPAADVQCTLSVVITHISIDTKLQQHVDNAHTIQPGKRPSVA